MTGRLEILAPDGVPEVGAGDDLAALVLAHCRLADGDVVVVTSKVVSKAEGRVHAGDREDAIDAETERVVARRGPTRIVRTRHGLTLAAAGVDASHVAPGQVALLPVDPDGSARRLRDELHDRAGVLVAVVVTDTAGRPWREGQTDIAIGVAGLPPLTAYAGRADGHGNLLSVTAPAVADEVAGAAELVRHKLSGRPLAVVRGLAALVLPAADHGPGAAALLRPSAADMFGLGAREAVVAALAGDPADREAFGAPAGAADLVAALRRVLPGGGSRAVGDEVHVSGPAATVAALAFAHGWAVASSDGDRHVLAAVGRAAGRLAP